MNINGAKINFLGDSITEGVGASEKGKRYTDLFAAETGAMVRNYGISGTRIARQQRYPGYVWKPQWDDYAFTDRFEGMDDDADCVVIFGGTNDYGHGNAPFGEENDREPDSFIGACHYLLASLIIKYPEARIVVMTPMHRSGDDALDSNGRPLSDYVDTLRTIAEYYGCYVLDMFNTCIIDPRDEANREKYAPDGLHPSDAGYEIIKDMLIDFIGKL